MRNGNARHLLHLLLGQLQFKVQEGSGRTNKGRDFIKLFSSLLADSLLTWRDVHLRSSGQPAWHSCISGRRPCRPAPTGRSRQTQRSPRRSTWPAGAQGQRRTRFPTSSHLASRWGTPLQRKNNESQLVLQSHQFPSRHLFTLRNNGTLCLITPTPSKINLLSKCHSQGCLEWKEEGNLEQGDILELLCYSITDFSMIKIPLLVPTRLDLSSLSPTQGESLSTIQSTHWLSWI